MKFYDGKFTIDKKYFEELAKKVQIFREKTKTRKSIFVTLITVFGLVENEYKLSRVQNEIIIDNLYS
ncbi:ATPase [Lacihabitans sp. LS3-19]|uniref:hypothetical protein n=1 Tax=Lacihabitans sp. LS3-19 TaxID=2487335 RepID=UPI0020CF61E2|nr:hypothetical protein [Lacihabitans sp. LS3-19]MCP9769533.1 ATPase [Lacihabitans sp. LS3-19]